MYYYERTCFDFEIYEKRYERMINYDMTADGELVIFSTLGNVVAKMTLSAAATNVKVDTKSWSEGLYFIKIYSGKQEVSSSKLIIIH